MSKFILTCICYKLYATAGFGTRTKASFLSTFNPVLLIGVGLLELSSMFFMNRFYILKY